MEASGVITPLHFLKVKPILLAKYRATTPSHQDQATTLHPVYMAASMLVKLSFPDRGPLTFDFGIF